MKKLHQLLPNIAFFSSIALVYFGLTSWATFIAGSLIALFVYFDNIDDDSAFKYAFGKFGSMLLFIPLAYFQLGILPVGVLVFLLGWIVSFLRIKNFRLVVPGLYLSLLVTSILGYYLPEKLTHLQTHTELDEMMPDFEIKDFKSGEIISNTDLQGKIVVANFWATWCGTCIKEMRPLNNIYTKYKDNSDVVFLAVNTPKWSTDEYSQIERLITKKSISLPIYIDENNEMTEGFDISSIPTLFIIDKKGKMRVRHIGFTNEKELEDYINEQIKKLL